MIDFGDGWANNRPLRQVPVWASLQMNKNLFHSIFPFRWMIFQSLRIYYQHIVALPPIVKGVKNRIFQQFYRTTCYFWYGDKLLRKNHARYEFSSPCKRKNSDSYICNCSFERFNIRTIRQGMLWCTTSPEDAWSARRSATKLHSCSGDKVSCRWS